MFICVCVSVLADAQRRLQKQLEANAVLDAEEARLLAEAEAAAARQEEEELVRLMSNLEAAEHQKAQEELKAQEEAQKGQVGQWTWVGVCASRLGWLVVIWSIDQRRRGRVSC